MKSEVHEVGDITWEPSHEAAITSPVLTDTSESFLSGLSAFDEEIDSDMEGCFDVFKLAHLVTTNIANHEPKKTCPEPPLLLEPPPPPENDTEDDADDEDEDDTYVPGEELSLRNVWTKTSRMTPARQKFMGKFVLGAIWDDTPIKWTFSNLRRLWKSTCKGKGLCTFLQKHRKYIKCVDKVYTPTRLAIDTWGDTWTRKWDHLK